MFLMELRILVRREAGKAEQPVPVGQARFLTPDHIALHVRPDRHRTEDHLVLEVVGGDVGVAHHADASRSRSRPHSLRRGKERASREALANGEPHGPGIIWSWMGRAVVDGGASDGPGRIQCTSTHVDDRAISPRASDFRSRIAVTGSPMPPCMSLRVLRGESTRVSSFGTSCRGDGASIRPPRVKQALGKNFYAYEKRTPDISSLPLLR